LSGAALGDIAARIAPVAAMLAVACPAVAQTAPGTAIDNVADARWTTAATPAAVRSNRDRLIVGERLDVALAAGRTPVADAADPVRAIPFVLSNAGTGSEAFALTTAPARPGEGEGGVRLAADRDGDGRYDPARDAVLADGRTPELATGAALTLFALVPGGGTDALAVEARALTGSGDPGTAFAGAGDGGGDAVTGATGARARLMLEPDGVSAGPALVKSQAVRAPDGSERAGAGAIVTYTLSARLAGSEAEASVEDPIPAGTRYLSGTLSLDGAPLSDAADADPGAADDARITVRLPAPAGTPAIHTVRFAVRIP